MPWVDFTNTAGFPSDGRGGLNATTGTAYTTNDTLFTETTVTGPTFLGTLTNAQAGRVITAYDSGTSSVWWGIITAVDAAASPDVITVDRWRKWGFPGSRGVPVANSDLIVYTNAIFGKGNERYVIDSLEIRKATAADTITITDLFNNVVKVLTVGATAGPLLLNYNTGGPPYEGPQGWEINGPFIAVTSAATTICTINFRIISGT